MAKVDINMEGRSESEVNEPYYTPWFIARVHSASLTVNGVTFTLTATGPNAESAFRCGWSKTLVSSPTYMRLVDDGIKVDNDTLLKYPGKQVSMELHITGLPVGTHTIQTYHNIFEDTVTVNYSPMNVYLNGNLTYSRVKRSVLVKTKASATVLMTELNVTSVGQEMVLRFESIEGFTTVGTKKADMNVCMNGFELNSDDASKISNTPYPEDRDYHANADGGTINLTWLPAVNGYTKMHTLYFGTDSTTIANATSTNTTLCKGTFPVTTMEYKLDGMYSMQKYSWRVDETDSAGLVTKGKVWSFQPRQLAFKAAEGYGRFATGGRGGKVVHVTNLNDDGIGSFRQAVTSNYGEPRTVVFDVSGIIYLNSRLVMGTSITVAGQTAPGKGICFRAAPIGVSNDGICRFIRLRLGGGTTYDGMGMAGVNHGIMDHCSIGWTIDEAFSSRGAKNITLQRTLISEALNVAGHQNYPAGTAHGYAGSIGGDCGSFHHNLLAHCEGRNWSMAGGLDGSGYYSGRLDLFNTIVYNWGGRANDGGVYQGNVVNNYYKKGPATTQNYILNAQLEGTGKGSQSYYYSGNIKANTDGSFACDGTDNTCARTYSTSNGQVVDWTVFVDKPFFPSYAKIESAKDAYKSVLSDVGCTMPALDDHDIRIVKETQTGTYTYVGSVSGKKGLIDNEADAGGYENYPQETRPADFDTDGDGLPNWWEELTGTNLHSANGDFSDANADPDKDGYTNLENYLEWMSVQHYFIPLNGSQAINLATLTVGYTKSPVYSTVSAPKMNITYNASVATVTPVQNVKGINYFDFKVTDSDGSSFTRTIGICSGANAPTDVNEVTYKDNQQTFNVYPTEFSSEINVTANVISNMPVTISLTDIAGKVILKNTHDIYTGSNNLRIMCPQNLPLQVYLVKIQNSNTGEVLSLKKVVKH